jgi:hypothetical protein
MRAEVVGTTRSAEDRLQKINDNTNSSPQPVLCRVWLATRTTQDYEQRNDHNAHRN